MEWNGWMHGRMDGWIVCFANNSYWNGRNKNSSFHSMLIKRYNFSFVFHSIREENIDICMGIFDLMNVPWPFKYKYLCRDRPTDHPPNHWSVCLCVLWLIDFKLNFNNFSNISPYKCIRLWLYLRMYIGVCSKQMMNGNCRIEKDLAIEFAKICQNF